MSDRGRSVIVVFGNGESAKYPTKSTAVRELGLDTAVFDRLLNTGEAYNPKQVRRKENVGLTVDYELTREDLYDDEED